MQTFYSDQDGIVLHPSLFLAGPSPRSADVPSWRPQALDILADLNFQGQVLLPERRDGSYDYIKQVEWEFTGLESVDLIVFWVPRDLKTLPGFTTNCEFGRYVDSGRILYGRPNDAPKNRYLDWLYEKVTANRPYEKLSDLLSVAVLHLL